MKQLVFIILIGFFNELQLSEQQLQLFYHDNQYVAAKVRQRDIVVKTNLEETCKCKWGDMWYDMLDSWQTWHLMPHPSIESPNVD